jgi:hypothetical protein
VSGYDTGYRKKVPGDLVFRSADQIQSPNQGKFGDRTWSYEKSPNYSTKSESNFFPVEDEKSAKVDQISGYVSKKEICVTFGDQGCSCSKGITQQHHDFHHSGI